MQFNCTIGILKPSIHIYQFKNLLSWEFEPSSNFSGPHGFFNRLTFIMLVFFNFNIFASTFATSISESTQKKYEGDIL